MAPALQALMCGTVGMGVPLAMALWELHRLKRDRRDDRGPWRRDPGPRAPRPLPDCLRPLLPPVPDRPNPVGGLPELERV